MEGKPTDDKCKLFLKLKPLVLQTLKKSHGCFVPIIELESDLIFLFNEEKPITQ